MIAQIVWEDTARQSYDAMAVCDQRLADEAVDAIAHNPNGGQVSHTGRYTVYWYKGEWIQTYVTKRGPLSSQKVLHIESIWKEEMSSQGNWDN